MLVSKKHKKVVLNLRNPSVVQQVIPTSKEFELRGKSLLAVPHGVNETIVLNNLGFRIPSPIVYDYEWSGQYTPFKAQEHTADFLVRNKRAFVLNDLGCVDSDTEYLTPTGWRKISEYEGGLVGQYHPETGAVEFVEPEAYVKKPCKQMYHIKTKYGVDQMLSPEHRMLIEERHGARREVVQAYQMFERQRQWLAGQSNKRVGKIGWYKAAIPATYKANGEGLALSDDEIRLQVACIADGHFPNQTPRCRINIKKPRKIARLQELLENVGVEAKLKIRADGFHTFVFQAPTREKDFSGWWAADAHQLEIIADEVLHWDGHQKGGRKAFFSTSRASADFVQHVFCTQGFVARVTSADREEYNREYTVSIRSDGQPLKMSGTGSKGEKLANMRQCESTDGYKYCFMVPSTFLIFRRNGCVFASGNTGKSLSCLWAVDYLRKLKPGLKVLVVAPLSTLESTWAAEIFQHFLHLQSTVLHGSRQRRLRLLNAEADIYLINHDGVKVIKDQLVAKKFDIVIVDEIAAFRNARTDRWKALNAITAKADRVWGLTGTPTPNEPTDAYGQCKLLVPQNVPPYFGAFQRMTMKKSGPFDWKPKPEATDIVTRAMQPAIRYTRDQCVDIPDCTYQVRSVVLSPEQKKAYDSMRARLVAEVDAGKITAVNAAVKSSKLVQIAGGVLYDEKQQEHVIGAPNRVEVLREIIEQAGGKIIVFVPFRSMINYVAEKLKDLHVGVVHGGVNKNARAQVFHQFQKGKSMRVLLAQPAAMSHGLTLTASNTIVWYAPITSAETYVQANGRITRPGQKNKQFIINLAATPLEHKMNLALKNKQKLQDVILDMLAGGDV
jgi:superfamily II DNA or RNA helicase